MAAGSWGDRFEGGFSDDFWLWFAFTAMGMRVLVDFFCFGVVFDLILSRLQGRGAKAEVYFSVDFDYAKATWPKSPHTAPKTPKLVHLTPKIEPT